MAPSRRTLSAWLLLALLPVLVHLPALSGRFRIDPIYVVSGVTPGTWTTNGLVPGFPWVDGNAGVTTEALGGLAAHDWLAGKLPWWNPYSGVGMPLAAEGQTPAFFLPFVLLLALPHGLLALRMVLMALAGLFSFALLRRMRLDNLPALTGAAVFELNGTFAWIAHGPMLPVAFLPLVLLGLEQAKTRFAPAVTLGVAWSLAAGFPETAFLDLAFAAIWGAVRLRQAPEPWRYAARAGLPAMAGLLLAAPAVWPFLEALPREFVGTHAGVVASGFKAGNLALLLLPGIFGAPMAGPLALGLPDALWVRAGGYCDVILLALALLALQGRGGARSLRWAITLWLLLTAARAMRVPLAVWLFGLVPMLRQANVHLYVLPSWSMGLAILAALALQDWRRGTPLPVWRTAVLMSVLIGAAFAIAWPDVHVLWLHLAGYPVFVALAVGVPLLTLTLLLTTLRARCTTLRLTVVSLAGIANASLLFALPQFAGTHGRAVDTGAIAYLQTHAGLGRVLSLGPLVPNFGALYGVAEIAHNALPAPELWVDYVRAHLMPASDGVNFYWGWPPDKAALMAMLPAYRAAGASLAVVPAGVAPFDTGGPNPPSLAYRGAAMDIWNLPGEAPYFQAPGCAVRPQSRARATTECPTASTLRRAELFWPGWQAHIGADPVPIAVADGVFEAVAVPAGVSQVVFSYAPPGIEAAWVCFAAGAAGLVAVICLGGGGIGKKGWGRCAIPPKPPVNF